MPRKKTTISRSGSSYEAVLKDIAALLDAARRASARAVNTVMTTTYWAIGGRIVEHEQRGRARAGYGEALIDRLAEDLTRRFGRGFARSNLFQMRAFYVAYREIVQTPSGQSIRGAKNPDSVWTIRREETAPRFPLPWSHYARLLSLSSSAATSPS